MMEVFAIDAVHAARSSHGVELDYSSDSVRDLDQILERAHKTLRMPEDMSFAFPDMWGGYLGEVIRRKWGGQWFIPSDGPFKDQICLAVRGETISPPNAGTQARYEWRRSQSAFISCCTRTLIFFKD